MKMNRIFMAVIAGVCLLSSQSCLKEQADIFPESSSERLQSYLDEAQKILTSAENGWIMEYYPGSGQSLGGYSYHLSFTDSEVEAVFELDPANSYKSLYKMTSDNGAVLSFDSYNAALHYFATPSSSEYQAKGGDFEFTITSVSPEKIGLKGKRSGNHYDLYPYEGEVSPKEYMAKVAETGANMRAAFIDGTVGETQVHGTVDLNHRRITFSYNDSYGEEVVVEAPYMYTSNGIRTYELVEVAGYHFREMQYHAANNIFTTGSVTFTGSLPEDYTNYADFEGSYKFVMYGGRIEYDVVLTANDDKSGYVMSGILPQLRIRLGYDKALGRLTMDSQAVGADGSNTVWLAAWSLGAGGNLTWAEGYGMTIARDLQMNGRFVFEDNGKTDMVVDSFILWATTSSGTSSGQFTGWGDNQFPYVQYLIKK